MLVSYYTVYLIYWDEICRTHPDWPFTLLYLEVKSGQVVRLVHQQELGCNSPYVEATVLFSKASRRVLRLTQLPVCWHRAASPMGHEAYLSVPRLQCIQLYLHFSIRILASGLISWGYLSYFPNFFPLFLLKVSGSRISSTCHVVLGITSRLSSALDDRPATLVERRGYTSL